MSNEERLPEVVVSVSGGVAEVWSKFDNIECEIIDFDDAKLEDREDIQQEYYDRIVGQKSKTIIQGICPWCLEGGGCSYWEHGEECDGDHV